MQLCSDYLERKHYKKPWAPKGRERVIGMPSSRRAEDGRCYQRWHRFMIITDKLSAKMNASERLEMKHAQRLLGYSVPPPPEMLGAGREVDIYFWGPLFDLAILSTACAWLVSGTGRSVQVRVQLQKVTAGYTLWNPRGTWGEGELACINANACAVPSFISSDILLCPLGLENSLELVAILIK